MKKLKKMKKDFPSVDISELTYLLSLTNLLDFKIIKHEQSKQKIDGKKFIKCIPSNLIDKLDEVIDIICKNIINPNIFKIFEMLSTLSNLKLSKKLTTRILNATTFIGIAYLIVISALNA